MKVSVIVPIYNIKEFYLRKCIDSLLSQTLNEIEIILVNDASTDDCIEPILAEYERLHPLKIKVIIHLVNKHIGGARNTGLVAASGEFVGFVDADDYIVPEMYKRMYEEALSSKSDIISCDYMYVSPDFKVLSYEYGYNGVSMQDRILNPATHCTKILNRAMLMEHDIFFPENMAYEDNAIWGLHLLYAKKITHIPKAFYYYIKHPGSTSQNVRININDKVKAGEMMLNTMSKRGFLDKYPNEILGVYFKSYFRGTYRIIMKYNADYFSELQVMIEKMKGNGIVLSSQLVKESLSPKERFEIFLLDKMPNLFKMYVDLKFSKYKKL